MLGDAVTPEVAAAWDEVYWLMANALINQERGLYSARGVRPETVWRPWRVERKIRETADVVTFVVKRVDDRLVKTSLPGQYVTVRMPMPDGMRQPRQYSLTRADDGEHRQFSRQAGARRRQARRRGLDPAARRGRRRRRTDPVAALRRRRARRRRTSRGVRQRRHRASLPWPACSRTSSPPAAALSITVLHADLDEASFALRRQVVSDVLALRNASLHLWYEKAADSNEPVAGSTRA